MITLIPRYRAHIPNKLAIFAALVLAVTSFAGFSQRDSVNPELAVKADAETSLQADGDDADLAPVKRKLNISALLFGHG
jgi:hypothetical protein